MAGAMVVLLPPRQMLLLHRAGLAAPQAASSRATSRAASRAAPRVEEIEDSEEAEEREDEPADASEGDEEEEEEKDDEEALEAEDLDDEEGGPPATDTPRPKRARKQCFSLRCRVCARSNKEP